jgi:Transposase DDE domain
MKPLDKLSLAILLTEGNFSCVKAARSLGIVSHDHLTRLLKQPVTFKTVLTPLEQLPKHGYLAVDDTVVAKPFAEHIEGLAYVWSGNDEKIVMGMSVFLAVWHAEGHLHLVQVELPGEHSKHELFQTLLTQLKEAGCEPDCIYFDNWYASSETLNLIDSLDWTYVTRIKANRLFAGKPLQDAKFWGGASKKGPLKGLKHKVQVVKHGNRYLATNVLHSTTTVQLAKKYQNRWVIETVFRALKSVLHLEKCHCRSLQAQFNHLLAAVRAFEWLRRHFPTLGPELAQREFLHMYRSGQLKPEHILTQAA